MLCNYYCINYTLFEINKSMMTKANIRRKKNNTCTIFCICDLVLNKLCNKLR